MRRQVVEKLAREYLLSDLPGFVVTRGIIHKMPIGGLLRGFWFDSSAFGKYVSYLYVFVQPLYVPRDHLVFTFGRRLECRLGFLRSDKAWELGPESWGTAVPALRRAMVCDGLPFLKRRDSIELLVRNLKYGIRVENSIFDREALAYSLARLGRYREAERGLKSLIRSIKPDDLRQDVRKNAEDLLASIQAGPDRAQELLDRWTEETARNLRLPAPV